ncbi:hypothetical protein E4U19_001823 [Claviceps sp. Clav32 group G5]|nr:hypothetical protein E4U40_007299 [Claviceps sp. LM458 group G5]KAG6027786.1 hypothetical protein E4U19_001823 [Claviceps sp. Clav32 group G5]KAG6045629.1 hypothetical protein E4U39_002115 [Claviceps sp. Clav50 group G5]
MSPSGPSNWILGNGLSGDRMRRGTIRLQTLNYQLNHFSVKRSSLLFDVNYTPATGDETQRGRDGGAAKGLVLPTAGVESRHLLHVRRSQMRKRV